MKMKKHNYLTDTDILGPPDEKNQLIGKDSDAGKDWGQKEKGAIEEEMVGWYHGLNGHKFEKTPGDGEGQVSLVSFSSCGQEKSATT